MTESAAAAQSIPHSLEDLVNAAFERVRATSVGRGWARHHPSWVLLRGWLLLIAWAHIYTGSAFSVFPIPNATAVPFEWSSGVAILLAATAISWAVARAARTAGSRILDAGLSALVLYTVFAAAINS